MLLQIRNTVYGTTLHYITEFQWAQLKKSRSVSGYGTVLKIHIRLRTQKSPDPIGSAILVKTTFSQAKGVGIKKTAIKITVPVQCCENEYWYWYFMYRYLMQNEL
jgi:hypothetical protein